MKLILSMITAVLLSMGVYTILILPNIIYITSNGANGIYYPTWVMWALSITIGIISGLLVARIAREE